MVDKFSSDTMTVAEGTTVKKPGGFSQIPQPRVWANGDDLDTAALNVEWRDTFNWLLRKTVPAFEGQNSTGLTLTAGASIAIPTEVLIRGNITHATNDSKVYVWETGWYLVNVQVGALLTGVTGTNFTSVLKVNGAVRTTGDTVRVAGGNLGVGHLSSVYLFDGDYLEMALDGSWSGGTVAASTTSTNMPVLNLWWRNIGNGINP